MLECADNAPNHVLFRTPVAPDLGKWVTVHFIRPRFPDEDPCRTVVFDFHDPATRGYSPAAEARKFVGVGDTFPASLVDAVRQFRAHRATQEIIEEPEVRS